MVPTLNNMLNINKTRHHYKTNFENKMVLCSHPFAILKPKNSPDALSEIYQMKPMTSCCHSLYIITLFKHTKNNLRDAMKIVVGAKIYDDF